MANNIEIPKFELDPGAQDRFYESSVNWIKSLKDRHDPFGYLDILPNDTETHPYQLLGISLVEAYQPSLEEILEEGDMLAVQERVLEEMRDDADSVIGPGGCDRLAADMLASHNLEHTEPTLKIMYERLGTAGKNTAAITWHPNIMALPIYSAATAVGLSQAEFSRDEFDLFKFNKQNLMFVNPALAVASFRGRPVMENLSRFCTQIKTPPPTKNSKLYYGEDKPTCRYMISEAKKAYEAYMQDLTAQGKSTHLTIDPTASTIEPVIKDDELVAMRRKAVNRPVRGMVLQDFDLAFPMTMLISRSGSSWYVGDVGPLNSREDFDGFEEELDRHTEQLAGVKVITGSTDRELGQTALI